MQIRGREVDFRITRLKDAAAMEKALDHMAESEKKINRKGKLTEIMSATIEMFRNFVKESTGEDVLEAGPAAGHAGSLEAHVSCAAKS